MYRWSISGMEILNSSQSVSSGKTRIRNGKTILKAHQLNSRKLMMVLNLQTREGLQLYSQIDQNSTISNGTLNKLSMGEYLTQFVSF
jgi:hypothetical protein